MSAEPRCPKCGHQGYQHRENRASSTTKLDGPVPCVAVVGSAPVEREGKATTFVYTFCLCTEVMPLPADMRTRVASVSQPSRRKKR